MTDLHTKTVKALSDDLKAKRVSSRELTAAYLARINKYDKNLNSFITVCEESALETADIADALRQKGEGTALTGIPIAQKDIFCTDGVKTTCGSKMLDNFIAPYDATLIHKCNLAGMVMLGKTNMDEFAMGSSNENSYYGPVKNPWDTDYVPGGSSGGSAAAVAARLAPIATGTDTGGSIRQPAALCGITGLKPTYGRVSRYGMIAFASSLDQGGPMAKTAEDCALLMNVICGFDEKDSTSAEVDTPDFCAHLNDDIKGCRIGLAKEFFTDALDPAIAELTHACAEELKRLGAEIVEISLPNLHLSLPTYYIIAPAECSSNLARYDGVRYGFRCENPTDLLDMYERTRSEGFGAEVQRRIMIGTYALSAGYYDAYYIKAQKIRRLIHDDFIKAFEKVDVMLCPTTPTPTFKLGERTDDPIAMYLSDIYTLALNLAGLPGLSMPAGFLEGKPVGVQLFGKHFDESKILNVAHRYQLETDWHQQFPVEGVKS